MPRFRTKIVEIEAHQWTGDNFAEMREWAGALFVALNEADRNLLGLDDEFTAQIFDFLHSTWIGVKTGQWIVRGAVGEFYPCDNETFHWKYEQIDDNPSAPYKLEDLRQIYGD